IENISLPDEVEKAIDRRTSMGVVGDLNQYTQFQAAEAMRDAANNPNGMGGLGAGMGAAAMMAQAMQNAAQQPVMPQYQQAAPVAQQPQEVRQAAEPAAPAVDTKFCSECGQRIPRAAKFCPECGAKQA
ncbi:MAG: zinc-ribbon domain-containing protein, partial [Clostridia bacterium]|nr:zinc-ribbon domain-containing protein [Clostridia bacterium]